MFDDLCPRVIQPLRVSVKSSQSSIFQYYYGFKKVSIEPGTSAAATIALAADSTTGGGGLTAEASKFAGGLLGGPAAKATVVVPAVRDKK